MKLLTNVVFSLSLIFALAEQATAHSGGTDRYGCHAGSRPYHCHSGGASRSSNGGQRNRGDDVFIAIVVLGGIAVTLWGIYVIASLNNNSMATLDKINNNTYLSGLMQSKQFYLSSVMGKNWGLGLTVRL